MILPAVDKKIMAAILTGDEKVHISAKYTNGTLYIIGLNKLGGDTPDWIEKFGSYLAEKSADDWTVLVEDATGMFSEYAVPWDFNEISADGRLNMQVCFDWYFAMQSLGKVQFIDVPEIRLRAGSEGALVELRHDDKGRMSYRMDWYSFNARHKALLMCIAAVVLEEPFSERWVRKFCGGLEHELTPLEKMLKHIEILSTFETVSLSEKYEKAVAEKEAQKRVHING